MQKIIATSLIDTLDEERPAVYISGGAGNLGKCTPEVHLHVFDPVTGHEIRLWVKVADLVAAVEGVISA